MTRQTENTGFLCLNCNQNIEKLTNGGYRNHCPYCLYSLHVDDSPGDRLNACKALMKPIGLTYKKKKGWQLRHCCMHCGTLSSNKVAVDTVQPDNLEKLAKL